MDTYNQGSANTGGSAPAPMSPMGGEGAPAGGIKPEYIWAGAVLVIAVVAASFFVLRNVQANADYICTSITEFTGGCSDGSWAGWQTISSTENKDTCTTVKAQERTYTGTRTTKRTLQYLNLRTACAAGYTQAGHGEGGGSSGFHGGTVFTESSACQIKENRNLTTAITNCTPKGAGAPVKLGASSTTRNEADVLGSATTTRKDVGSFGELEQYRRGMIAGAISAHPALVRAGETTLITWQGREVTSCAVSGSNGDSWTGLTAGEEESGAITSQTTYTLTCEGFDGTRVSEQTIVDIIPQFQEQ